MKPTPDEERNGWTTETLKKYLEEREGPKEKPEPLPTVQNKQHPFWR